MGWLSGSSPEKNSSGSSVGWGSSGSTPSAGKLKHSTKIRTVSMMNFRTNEGKQASSFGLTSLRNTGVWTTLTVGTENQKWLPSLVGKFGISGTILSFILCLIFLKLGGKNIRIPGLNKIPFLGRRLSSGERPKALVPRGTQSALRSITGIAPGLLSRINPLNWRIFNRQKIAEEEDDEKYQAGEPYGDPSVMATGLAKDLKSVGLKAGVRDLRTLLQVVKSKGKPVNDREMTVSHVLGTKRGQRFTDIFVDGKDDRDHIISATTLKNTEEVVGDYH